MSIIPLIKPDQRATRARVKTTAFRGYIVELDPQSDGPARLLEDLGGNVVHFRCLERVREALKRRGVEHAELVQHHACEELGAFANYPRREDGVPVMTSTED